MKLLALVVLLAVIQTSPPVPRKTANSGTPTGNSVQQQTDTKKANPAKAPTVADTSQAHNAAGSDQNAKNQQSDVSVSKLPTVSVEPDWGMYVFSALLVIVGAMQLWLLYRTWGQIERQAGIMQRQTLLIERQINKERAHIRVELEDFKPAYP